MLWPGTSVPACLCLSFCPFRPLLYGLNRLYLFVTFSLVCLQTLSPSTALTSVVSHSQLLSLSLRLSVCLSLTLPTNRPRPLAAFEVLVNSWLCVWQGSPSKAGPHEYSAAPFEWPSPRTLSWQRIGCPLSQWEPALTGAGGYDNRGCWVFHRFEFLERLYMEMWKVNSQLAAFHSSWFSCIYSCLIMKSIINYMHLWRKCVWFSILNVKTGFFLFYIIVNLIYWF